MNIKKLQFFVGLILCFMMPFFAMAQTLDEQKEGEKKEKKELNPNFKHHFTALCLEVRAGLEYQGELTKWYYPSGVSLPNGDVWQNHYGFRGDYFNLKLGGDIGDHISYYICQRIVPTNGSVNFFDNTDFLYLQYKFNKQWSLRMGKEAIYMGGFEYDAAPIDVYYFTHYWGSFPCFLIGMSAAYTDKSGKNKIVFNVANSPYVHYMGNNWNSGLFSYNLYWSGKFGPFHALYSVNMMEYQRGKFINFIVLGNKLSFDKWSIYVDYINRAAGFRDFFQDFSMVSRLDWQVCPSVNLFAKGGYEQNFANYTYTDKNENIVTTDMWMPNDRNYWFYGLGVEYRPRVYPDLRVHAYVANAVMHHPTDQNNLNIDTRDQTLTANVGVTWWIDFMKFLPAKLK